MKLISLITFAVLAMLGFASPPDKPVRDANRLQLSTQYLKAPLAKGVYREPIEPLMAEMIPTGYYVPLKPSARQTVSTSPTGIFPNVWYDLRGKASLGVFSPPMPLDNFFGTGINLNFCGYTGAEVSTGVPSAGGLIYYPFKAWEGGGITVGLAGGWNQREKLAGRIFVGFYSLSQ